MSESDTFETRLEELLADRSDRSADATQTFEHIVRRARRRIARRRIVTATVVSGFFAAAVLVAVTANPGRSTPAPVEASTTTTATATIVPGDTIKNPTFSILDQPSTVVQGHQQWPGVRFDGGTIAISWDSSCPTTPASPTTSTPDPCAHEGLCGWFDVEPSLAYIPTSGYECQPVSPGYRQVPPMDLPHARLQPNEMADWALTFVRFLHREPYFIWGIVPDVVTRVTYDGRDVPITNNAFVIPRPAPFARGSHDLPLYFYIADCRKQVGYYSPDFAQGYFEAPMPHRDVTCGTTTTTPTKGRE